MSDPDDKNELMAPQTQEQWLQALAVPTSSQNQYLEQLPTEVKTRIRNHTNRMKHGLHAVAPLTCPGASKCLFFHACPIPQRDQGQIQVGPDSNYPVGGQCILEATYMVQKLADYVQHFDVDPQDPVEMSIVNELALLDLMKSRALMILSGGDRDGDGQDFMRTDITGYSETGQPSESTKLHPVLEAQERFEKRRQYWLEKLMATRKSKADWAAKVGHTQETSQVVEEIKIIREYVTALQAGEKQVLVVDDVPILLDEEDE